MLMCGAHMQMVTRYTGPLRLPNPRTKCQCAHSTNVLNCCTGTMFPTSFHADFLLGFFFDPEDGGAMLPRNVV
jgi:hypothetical protein